MFGKIHLSTIVLHVYILTYLIVTVINAPDYVLQILHVLCPIIAMPFLYYTIKSASDASFATFSEEEV
jgi:hypothetical protein